MHRFAQIEVLVAVVEEGSFTAAAERLNISKSHASRQVSELEERLGVRLLNRTTRHVSTTPEGETFVEECAHLMEEFERAERALAQRKTDPAGTLRLAAPMTYGVDHVSPVLAEFWMNTKISTSMLIFRTGRSTSSKRDSMSRSGWGVSTTPV